MKQGDPNPLEIKSPNLGILFTEFMLLYANLEYWNIEIRPILPTMQLDRSTFLQRVINQIEVPALTIIDPLNSLNNVSRTTHKFFYLRVQ